MYSKNDYWYYLEHQLMDSDDFLAHYGVKGMKWHKHKKNGEGLLYNLFGKDLERSMRLTFSNEFANGRANDVSRTANNVNKAAIKSIKEQNKPINKIKNKLKPKNQKVEITHRSEFRNKKASKSSDYHKEYDLNTGKAKYKKKTKGEKELENYGREAAIEMKKDKKKVEQSLRTINHDQNRGQKNTQKINVKKTIQADQDRGKTRLYTDTYSPQMTGHLRGKGMNGPRTKRAKDNYLKKKR